MLENTVIIIVVVIFSGVVENSTVEDEDLRPTNVVSLLLYALVCTLGRNVTFLHGL